nr:hypothetical protein [Tanacetum cinerariifolium]
MGFWCIVALKEEVMVFRRFASLGTENVFMYLQLPVRASRHGSWMTWLKLVTSSLLWCSKTITLQPVSEPKENMAIDVFDGILESNEKNHIHTPILTLLFYVPQPLGTALFDTPPESDEDREKLIDTLHVILLLLFSGELENFLERMKVEILEKLKDLEDNVKGEIRDWTSFCVRTLSRT